MKKPVQVVMLPTNEKANVGSIVTRPSDDRMAIVNVLTKDDPQPCIHQHLYILSDEEIKEGDWCYGMDGIFQYKGKVNIPDIELPKKIIATTDLSLDFGDYIETGQKRTWRVLPQPSQSFIEHFVEEYNKGNVITEVMVEYELYKLSNSGNTAAILENGHHGDLYRLKVNPKDNTITIKKVKDSWSREGVINLIINAINYGIDSNGNLSDKWIEENL